MQGVLNQAPPTTLYLLDQAPPNPYIFPNQTSVPVYDQPSLGIASDAKISTMSFVVNETEQDRRLKKIKEKMRSFQGFEDYGRIIYSDLCIFSKMSMPKRFKIPNFEKYDGTNKSIVHLQNYLENMALYKNDENS